MNNQPTQPYGLIAEHPPEIALMLAGAPPDAAYFLAGYMNGLLRTGIAQALEVKRLTQQRNELTGIATAINDDLVEARATADQARAAGEAAASLIAQFKAPKTGGAA